MDKVALQDYFQLRSSSTRPVPLDTQSALAEYLRRYSKDDDTLDAPKYYCGEMGTAIFTHFKEFEDEYRKIKDVKRELIKGIKDPKLTKMFYGKKDMFDNLERFGENFVPNRDWNKYIRMAVKILTETLAPLDKLKPLELSEENAQSLFKKMNTSVGFMKYGEKKRDMIPEMIEGAQYIKQELVKGTRYKDIITNPSIALTRSQLGSLTKGEKYMYPWKEDPKGKYKGRLVFGEDGEVIAFEAQYARVATDYVAEKWSNIATGKSPRRLRSIVIPIGDCPFWVSIDFSNFDASVQSWIIALAFKIVKTLFPDECANELDFICYKFTNMDILMPDGNIYRKKKGIPSGSYFTQLIGSIVNAIMITTFMLHLVEGNIADFNAKFRLRNGELSFICMGDDNIFGSQLEIDLEYMAKYFRKMFGMTLHPHKCAHGTWKDTPTFLKRDWHVEGEWRSPLELLLNVMHPERKRTYEGYSAWHILYGYWFTFRLGMEEIGFNESNIVRHIEQEGYKLRDILDMPLYDLPGSLQAFARSDWEGWMNSILSAEQRYCDVA